MTNDRDRVIPAKGDTLKVRIFYSYSVEDQAHQKSLEKHLAILRQTGRIEEWHHRKILAGEHRERRMKKELVEADIILLLLTPDFIDSKYCYSTEMTFAIQAEEKGLAIVIPLLIRPSSWQDTPLGK
ncbi:MAG TPA: toll/interleukin-1 receptor domain-containing protein, partial [Ktedonobacteraceae bacterium]|nr:toll/interleukin-1 receptor domain-containing protein [Ktedonobacteraceae bacterium]